MNRRDLQNLAEERLDDAQVLLANNRFGAAYYVVGYAVECGLKACIARLTKAEDFYDKTLARNIFKHDLEDLANYAGLDVKLLSGVDAQFAANWAQVKDWSEESRYEGHTQIEAEQMIKAVQDPAHGVMQCIRRYW
jgi:HEPN domain-containing protein